MNGRAAVFQTSYNRAAAAVFLWCAAGLLPVLIASVRVPTVKNMTGLVLASMYMVYGLVQLQAAIRKRQRSDIIVFGVVPVTLAVACTIALIVTN